MDYLPAILICLGLLAAVAGGIVLLVAAFRESVGWGLAVLLLPLANIAFVIVRWSKAKLGFLINLAGVAVMAGGVFSSPQIRHAIEETAAAKTNGSISASDAQARLFKAAFNPNAPVATPAPAPVPDLSARIQDHRTRLEQMEGQFAADGLVLTKRYQALGAKRNKLKANDAAGLAAFNAEAAAYQAQNEQRRQAQQTIAMLQQELEALLDQRAREAATGGSGGKKVIVYSSAHCPACQAAKSYLAQKHVPYEERDVNSNAQVRAEFEKLGGHGVPLILVGTQKMEGFNSQALDKLLM